MPKIRLDKNVHEASIEKIKFTYHLVQEKTVL